MTLRRLIARLLAISVIAGLVLAPLSRHAMAGTPSDASMSTTADDISKADDMSKSDDMSATAGDMSMSATAAKMTSDMPCCPSKAPVPMGCDQCVLMAACMSQCFAGVSAALFRPPFATSGKIAPLQNDAWPEGLGHPPPEHPPRVLV
jgi:hypothetical protein